MQVLMIISMAVTAIATGVIAWHAWKSNELSSKIQSRDDEFRQQISDLYKAIVISNVLNRVPVGDYMSIYTKNINEFNKVYYEEASGKTQIFKLRG